MNELTLILFMAVIGLYLLCLLKDRIEISWLTLFTSILSMAQTLTDTTLEEMEPVIMIIPAFYIMLMAGIKAYGIYGRRR